MILTAHNARPQRGFALLIAIVLTSVVLALGMALLDIAYKQVLLSSSAKKSQYAFYNADSALECALYYDQKQGAFYYGNNYDLSTVTCSNIPILVTQPPTDNSVTLTRTLSFSVQCPGGGVSADVTVIKTSSNATNIYSNGYSSCDANDPARIERGVKVKY